MARAARPEPTQEAWNRRLRTEGLGVIRVGKPNGHLRALPFGGLYPDLELSFDDVIERTARSVYDAIQPRDPIKCPDCLRRWHSRKEAGFLCSRCLALKRYSGYRGPFTAISKHNLGAPPTIAIQPKPGDPYIVRRSGAAAYPIRLGAFPDPKRLEECLRESWSILAQLLGVPPERLANVRGSRRDDYVARWVWNWRRVGVTGRQVTAAIGISEYRVARLNAHFRKSQTLPSLESNGAMAVAHRHIVLQPEEGEHVDMQQLDRIEHRLIELDQKVEAHMRGESLEEYNARMERYRNGAASVFPKDIDFWVAKDARRLRAV
jgi:hypothetical protein